MGENILDKSHLDWDWYRFYLYDMIQEGGSSMSNHRKKSRAAGKREVRWQAEGKNFGK